MPIADLSSDGVRRPVPWALAAASVLAVSAVVASADPVPRWELSLTERLNGVPDAIAHALWPVMQLGAAGAPIVMGAAAFALRRPRLGAALTVAGLGAWCAAKGVKQVFERGRPIVYLPEIDVREGDGSGLGFVSGHSAVAAACAVFLVATLPRRWRPIPIVLALGVGLARVVYGVHLPVDITGGWALGTLIGLACVRVVGVRPPRSTV